MKILIIEDDNELRYVLKKGLEQNCFSVDDASDGEIGSYMARTNHYDLIVLDNVLPKKCALNVCQDVRDTKSNVPILILSAKSESTEKVNLLNNGADDYITKPFSFEELLARINALLRRPQKIEYEKIEVGPITLDCKSQEVCNDESKIYLTRKEYSLLEFLIKNRGTILSRAHILEHVWQDDVDPFSNTIETHIRNLRRKIEDIDKSIIRNIPGRGYTIGV